MAGGAPIPIPVQGEDAMVLCMEDMKKIADAKFPLVIRGMSYHWRLDIKEGDKTRESPPGSPIKIKK